MRPAVIEHGQWDDTETVGYTPALVVEDSGNVASRRGARAARRTARQLVPPHHAVLATIAAILVMLVAVDWLRRAFHPVIAGHLRTAAALAVVVVVVLHANRRLWLRIERLHEKTQLTVRWWQERARIIDERDRAIHGHLGAVADDITSVTRGVTNLRRDLVNIAGAIGRTNGRMQSYGTHLASLSGGQAVVLETVERLASTVRQVIDQLGQGDGDPEPGAAWQAYQRNERDAVDSNVVSMPNPVVYEMGRRAGRREVETYRENGHPPIS